MILNTQYLSQETKSCGKRKQVIFQGGVDEERLVEEGIKRERIKVRRREERRGEGTRHPPYSCVL